MSAFNWDDAESFVNADNASVANEDEFDWEDAEFFIGQTTSGTGTDADPIKLEGEFDPSTNPATAEYHRQRTEQTQDVISKEIARVQQATTTIPQQLGITDDSPRALAKRDKETTTALGDLGFRVENRPEGKKVVVDPKSGQEFDYSSGMIDDLLASKLEIGGAMAGATLGATAGSAVPVVGTIIGGVVGGVAGAILGDQADVILNEKNINIGLEERLNRAVDVGATDLVASMGGIVVMKAFSKVFSKAPEVLLRFTSLDALPDKLKTSLKTLQEKSGLSDEAMESNIKEYVKTAKRGLISEDDALKAGAQGSHQEQIGYLVKASFDDPKVKTKILEETTKRSNIVGDALKENNELYTIYKGATKSDKDRVATNWTKLHSDLGKAGVDGNEPIMRHIEQNAKVFDEYEATLFNAVTKPDSAEAKNLVEGVGFRSHAEGNIYAATASKVKGVYDARFDPNTKAVNKLKKSILGSKVVPKELDAVGQAEGIVTNKSRTEASNIAKMEEVQAKRQSVMEMGVDKQAKKEAVTTFSDAMDKWKVDNVVGTKIDAKLKKQLDNTIKIAKREGMDEASMENVFKAQKAIKDSAQETPNLLTQEAKEARPIAEIKKEHAKANTPAGGDADAFRQAGETEIKSNKRRRSVLETRKEIGALEATGKTVDDVQGLPSVMKRDTRTTAQAKGQEAFNKAVDSGVDIYDAKPYYEKAVVKETIPKEAKKFDSWLDNNPTKDFHHYAKEADLSQKDIKAYYKGKGDPVPKTLLERKESVMTAGTKSPFNEKARAILATPRGRKDGVSKLFRDSKVTQKQVVSHYKELGKSIPASITNNKRWVKDGRG